jgi:hypothetical protein
VTSVLAKWIGIPKHFLRPRERTPWSLPAPSAPATPCAQRRAGAPPQRPGGAQRCVAVADAGQAPQDGVGSASGVLEGDGLGKGDWEGWGGTGAGLSLLTEAQATVDRTGAYGWGVELHRLQGELLLAQAGARHQGQEAEACLHQALDVARRHHAQSWELRAATSLGRLWQQQGKRPEAYNLLAPIYGWFTEGFDTADLQEAKGLLEALA